MDAYFFLALVLKSELWKACLYHLLLCREVVISQCEKLINGWRVDLETGLDFFYVLMI